jgi:hypothetical protein
MVSTLLSWSILRSSSGSCCCTNTFGGDQYRDLEGRDAERVEMGVPGGLVGEISVGMLEKASDHRASQRSLAHVSDRLIVNHIIAVAGTQQFKEVEAALGARGAEPVKWSLPSCVLKPLVALWRAPVSSTGSDRRSIARHVTGLGVAGGQLALRDEDAEAAQQRHQPRTRSSALDGIGRARSDAVPDAHRCQLAARPSPPCHLASASAHSGNW